MITFWRRRSRAAEDLRGRFLRRYAGRCLIVHRGLPAGWLEELMKQPGGAGYFRLDARRPPGRRPTPVEWLVHRQLLPLGLPLPLLVRVEGEALYLRHLTRGGRPVHPSEILWLLDEIRDRHHARLRAAAGGFAVEPGLDPNDNTVQALPGL